MHTYTMALAFQFLAVDDDSRISTIPGVMKRRSHTLGLGKGSRKWHAEALVRRRRGVRTVRKSPELGAVA